MNNQQSPSPNNEQINNGSAPQQAQSFQPLASPQPTTPPQPLPTSDAPTPPTSNLTPTPKKKPIIAILVVVIVLILVIAGVLFLFLAKEDGSSVNNSQNSSETQQSTTTPEATIASLKEKTIALAEEATDYIADEINDAPLDVTYRVPGNDFITRATADGGFYQDVRPVDDGPESYHTGVSALQADTDELIDYAKEELGYTYLDTISDTIQVHESELTILQKDKVICNIIKSISGFMQATCVYEDKLVSASEKLKPFISIIKASDDINTANSTKNPTTSYKLYTEDEHNGYDRVSIGVNLMPIHLIKGADQQDWQYVGLLNYQDMASCSVFERNVDISRAFEGESCYQETDDSRSLTNRTVEAQ